MRRPLSDEERLQLLSPQGRQLLRWMEEHPHAPRFNYRSGDRLTPAMVQRVRDFERLARHAPPRWSTGDVPPWVPDFVHRCLVEVPFYRRYGLSSPSLASIPPIDRSDLHREPWSFVPDRQTLDDMIVYDSSGTTGTALYIMSHPETTACYLPLLRMALATRDVGLEGGSGRVSIVLVGAQASTLTYATTASYLEEAGFVKVNLHPQEWRDPQDRERFLDACNAEVYTGDPLAFIALAGLPLQTRPRALVSSGMQLLPGLQRDLERHFGCPVLDVYSMNECRLMAVGTPQGHRVLAPDLYVEILDPDGQPCHAEERGEIAVTCGRNPFLPLLRYRTGDFARLVLRHGEPYLEDLEGRQPVAFLGTDGRSINNIDVTGVLKDFAFSQFALHQAADRTLRFTYRGSIDEAAARHALLSLFGRDQVLSMQSTDAPAAGKVIAYTSDLPLAHL